MVYNKKLEKLGTETAFAVSAEANAWKEKGNKVYPFHLGDINLQTPEIIRQNTNYYMNKKKNGYCPAEGVPELRMALANDVGKKRGVEYDMRNVIIQPGGKPTIWKFLATVMNKNDEVLYPNPGYPIYESQISYQGGIPIPYTYIETKNGFAIDIERLSQSITGNTKILIINNYQNPLSAASSQEELEKLAELAVTHNLWVLSDDAYFEIRYTDDKAKSIVAIPGMKKRTVILYTFSKKYAMTGWRIGASIGPANVIKQMARFNINDESCTNHFIQFALSSIVESQSSDADKILNTLRLRRNLCLEKLNLIDGIKIAKPESTFYLFPNITNIMEKKGYKSLDNFRKDALVNTGVSFCTRDHFGTPLPGEDQQYIRLAYSGINRNDISVGIDKLKNWIEN
ncbi:MAG: aspartate aminotransferase [Candidatus Marinimicrobia bacterium]|nr:aspartate aminotransferase [Candidatus Neomarinimicrobiota bacterium]